MKDLEQMAEGEVHFKEQRAEFDRVANNPLALYRLAARKGYHNEEDIRGTFLAETGYRAIFLLGKAIADKDKPIDDKTPVKKKRGTVKAETYQSFLDEASRLKPSEFSRHTVDKENLLVRYFPLRFGKNGSQPAANYESIKVGAIFNRMVQQAKNYVKKH